MLVYLIRHGMYVESTDAGGRALTPFPQTPISENGRVQVAALAEKIQRRGDRIDALYTSPYQRTKDSAVLLQSRLGIARLIVEDNLRDVWTPGWWGVPREELKAIAGDVYNVAPRTPDQESYTGMIERICRVYRSIIEKENGNTIGFMLHGDPIRVLLYRIEHPKNRVPPMRVLSRTDYLDKGEAWRLEVDTGGVLRKKKLFGSSGEDFGKGARKY